MKKDLDFIAGSPDKCLVFATGGLTNTAATTELVNLCGDGDTSTCPTNLPSYSNYGGFALRTPEGNPLICGGGSSRRSCQEFVPQLNDFQPGPTMQENRYYPAVVELADGSFWIMGSPRQQNQLNTTKMEPLSLVPRCPSSHRMTFPAQLR